MKNFLTPCNFWLILPHFGWKTSFNSHSTHPRRMCGYENSSHLAEMSDLEITAECRLLEACGDGYRGVDSHGRLPQCCPLPHLQDPRHHRWPWMCRANTPPPLVALNLQDLKAGRWTTQLWRHVRFDVCVWGAQLQIKCKDDKKPLLQEILLKQYTMIIIPNNPSPSVWNTRW